MNLIRQIAVLRIGEKQKIFLQRKYQLFLVITFLLTAAGGMMLPGVAAPLQVSAEHYPYLILSIISYVFAPLAIVMLMSDLITQEQVSDQIKILLTRPVSRQSILLAKMTGVMSYVSVLMTACGIASLFSLLQLEETVSFSLIRMILAYFISYFGQIAIMAGAAVIAIGVRSSAAGFLVSIFCYLGSLAAGIIFPFIAPFLLTSYLGIGSLVIGSVIPALSVISGLFLIFGYLVAFISVAILAFAKKEY